MTIKTPEFQGTHLWNRLCWAKENLEPCEESIVLYGKTQINQMNQQKLHTQTPIGWRVHYKVESYHQYLLTGNLAKDESTPRLCKNTQEGQNYCII